MGLSFIPSIAVIYSLFYLSARCVPSTPLLIGFSSTVLEMKNFSDTLQAKELYLKEIGSDINEAKLRIIQNVRLFSGYVHLETRIIGAFIRDIYRIGLVPSISLIYAICIYLIVVSDHNVLVCCRFRKGSNTRTGNRF